MTCSPISPKIAAAVAPRACLPAIPPMPLRQERAMKRLHVHVSVDDLAQWTRFYSTLFAAEPTVVKDDYVKWMLDDPRVNFAISTRAGRAAGISHLGIQAEDEDESPKFMTASPAPSARLSRRRQQLAATPNPTSRGSPIRNGGRGTPSLPTAKARSMAKVRWPSCSRSARQLAVHRPDANPQHSK